LVSDVHQDITTTGDKTMNTTKFLGLAVLTVSVSGIVQAAPSAKKSIRVVAGAQALSTADKANISGMCGCGGEVPTVPTEPTPVEPSVVRKPGYGFGAKVEHYGPPGQGFTNDKTWRNWFGHGYAANGQAYPMTPKGHNAPPKAFDVLAAEG
jgi:hypothetical protein